MVCCDSADLFSHPGGADGHFKTNAITENPFECPVEALQLTSLVVGFCTLVFVLKEIRCVEEGSVGSPGFVKTFHNPLKNNEQTRK